MSEIPESSNEVLTEDKLKELWSLAAQNSGQEIKDQPPFYVFNPSMYNEQYLEKMKNLQKKKDKRERKALREKSKNVKTTFVTPDEDYDIEQVLKALGETQKSKRNLKRK